VKRGKNGKARYVPVALTTAHRLAAYSAERIRLLGPTEGPFFRNDDGRRLTDCSALQLCDHLPGHGATCGTALLQARARPSHPRPAA
jgi:site-specific recombinase XerD